MDITDRKRVEEALRESEDRYRSVVSSMIEGVVVQDTGGVIISANASAERILGLPVGQIIGRTSFDPRWQSIHPDGTPFLGEEHPAVLARRNCMPVRDVVMGLRRPDGALTWISINAMPLVWVGGDAPYAVVVTFHDITARQQAEEALKRNAAELERANEEVKQFAYIVSHDLRAPLINLKGFAEELRGALEVVQSACAVSTISDEELRERAHTALCEDIPEALDYIESSASRMDHYVNALLRLSRLGRREMSFERLDLDEIIAVVKDGLAHQIETRQVVFTIYPLPEIIADRTAIEQIIGNLLTNAVLYLDPDRPGKIEVRAEQSSEFTTITVRDNGRGIVAEDLHKVFAPFRRAGKQDVKGEGMGMAYAQALAVRHGGHIRCESTPGVGTTFTVTLSNHPT